MMKRVKGLNSYLKTFLFLSSFTILLLNGATSAEFTVIDVSGEVKIARKEEEHCSINENDILLSGDILKTYRDSFLTLKAQGLKGQGLKVPDSYFKIHSYSTVGMESEPVLISGKLSKSKDQDFLDLHFYFRPQPAQGKTMRLVVSSKERNLKISARIENDSGYCNTMTFYPIGKGVYRALTGFDVESPPVKYRLKISASTEANGGTEITHPFYLKYKSYGRGKVLIDEKKRRLFVPSEQKRRESEALFRILSKSSKDAMWDGTFIYPANDPAVISKFGKKRVYYIGNRLWSSRYHRGIDFKGEIGAPVFSPNNGIVVFTGMRVTTGNTVVLEHGQGVFSLFYHLDSISVSEGSMIKKGDKIGEVGATGIAAGAHLHWSIFVNGVFVDPVDWIEVKF